MTQAITITLPDTLYAKLKRTATLSRQPIEEIVASSLAHILPPLLEDIPADYQADVFPLLQMSIVELQQETRRIFDGERWQRYEALLEQRKERALTAVEQTELDALRHEADVLMFRKGYAAVLLKRQGYQPPKPDELPRVQ
ncbi:MAG: hypothetical protein H6658_12950 [Ardenticatenaceae bacterium]|nr:hypothetical protein [Ardenticatenaceae bacterium]